jgi:hypothetical protein
MTDKHIEQLAHKFRHAIDAAYRAHEFMEDFCFKKFPTGCCGDTSYLLAEYLLQNGIETIWISTQRDDWTHAWLVLKDRRVGIPTTTALPDDYLDLISAYRTQDSEEETEEIHYTEQDLKDGLIIDITSDQFDDCEDPVYVDYMDDFHRTFDFRLAVNYDGLNDDRLEHLYEIIESYIC